MDNTKAIAKQKTASGVSNLLGIFVFLIGIMALFIGPAGYFESLSDTVAEGNRVSLGSALVSAVFGLVLVVLGYKMMQKRKKVSPQDLPAQFVDSCYVFVIDNSDKSSTNLGLAQVVASDKGIEYTAATSKQVTGHMPWEQIAKTKWASVYSYDAYKIVTDTSTFLFMAHDPADAQSKTRKYTATAAVSQVAGNVRGIKILAENEKNLSVLLSLHVYCRAYAPKNTTKWTSFFEYLFIGGLFRLAMLAIGIIWSSSLSHGLGYETLRMLLIGAGVTLGMGGFLYVLNAQLRGAQKLVGSKFM